MASITQTGPSSWRCLIRLKGHAPVCQTFKTRELAEKFGRDTERAMRGGSAHVAGGPTVAQLVATFRELRDAGARPISPTSSEHYYLVRLVADLGTTRIERVTPERLALYCKTRIADGVKASTVLEELNKLSTVIRHAAVRHKHLPDVVNEARPFLRYSGLIAPAQERDRRPSEDELARILVALEPRMQDIVQFAIATGARRGEICRVRWDGLSEPIKCLLIEDRKDPRNKAGNDGLVPMLAVSGYDAWAIIQRQPRTDDRIFPVNAEYVSDAFLHACRAAKVADLHFHDLRHEALSRMFEAGMTIEEVAVVSGHKDWRHLRRYVQLRPESLHDIHRGTQQRLAHQRTASHRRGTSEG